MMRQRRPRAADQPTDRHAGADQRGRLALDHAQILLDGDLRALLETHVKVLPFGQRHTGFCKNLKRGQHAFRRDATRRQPL